MTFEQAVTQTPKLKNAYCCGLGALRAEDKPHLEAEDTRRYRGSADIDAALRPFEPQANRWDFAIAYQHTNRENHFVYFVETHTADDSEVDRVIRKARWLLNWLAGEGRLLNRFEKEIIWISSGATRLTLKAPQTKAFADMGLKQTGFRLRIKNKRPG